MNTLGLAWWNSWYPNAFSSFTLQAAGVIPVAHNSGGPKSDIVVPYQGKPTGYLASTPAEYAEQFAKILQISNIDLAPIQANARQSVDRFSDATFSESFQEHVALLFTPLNTNKKTQ